MVLSTKESEMVYDGFLKIKQLKDTIKGKKVIREHLIVKDAVASILVDEEGKYGLVKQYRPAVKQYMYELVAGVLDKDLTPEDTLLEEIEEECEIDSKDVKNLTFINDYYMIVGFSDSMLKMYRADVPKQVNKKISDADVEEVVWVTMEEFTGMVEKNMINDSKTILAYYYIKSEEGV